MFPSVLTTGFLLIRFSSSVNSGVYLFSVCVVAAAYMERSKTDRGARVGAGCDVHEMKGMAVYVCGSLL